MRYFLKGQAEIDFAATVGSSKAIINKNPVDLIFLDLSLEGDEDGLDLAKDVRKTDKDLPIIAITAHALPADRQDAKDAGCTEFYSKPVNRSDILAILSRYFPVKTV